MIFSLQLVGMKLNFLSPAGRAFGDSNGRMRKRRGYKKVTNYGIMKRIYFTGVLLLTFTMSFAQFNYGVKGGVNLSNLHSNRFGNADEWKPAVHAGAWLSFDVTKRFT